ncbi:regulator of G-protein signaling loco, partial [Eurytemora carolleeae]|uniref:regulator of G-protein signaling loco n=1 Tax=Eurytemora carolleeae TaxID=1294199 RepID=UPI000C77E97F
MALDHRDVGFRAGAGLESPQMTGAGPEGAAKESPRASENLMQRRKKKFQYRGVKSYDIARGRFGFGFTLSGQGPCILSSVISSSPAELAGLKPGDSLLTVNGTNVSRLSHSEVVRLISQSQGLIRVQVSEGPNSDSSSDEEEKRRPKHLYRRQLRSESPLTELNPNYDNIELFTHPRTKPSQGLSTRFEDITEERFFDGDRIKERTGHHFRSNSADSSFIGDSPISNFNFSPSNPSNFTPSNPSSSKFNVSLSSTPRRPEYLQRKVDLGATEELSIGGELRDTLNPTINQLRHSMKLHIQRKLNLDLETAVLKCIVGYLGTIELSSDTGSTADLQGIRNCIRRFRVEKKVHTLVLFAIFEDCIVLINHHGLKLAEFQSVNVSFCGVCEDDKRFFGLVTSQAGHDNGSSSCHVFMVEPTSSEHERLTRARVFNIVPSYSPQGVCHEFPSDADPILSVIYSIKGVILPTPQVQGEEGGVSSSSSSSSSSNSDSGIGYREDGPPHQVVEESVSNEGLRLEDEARSSNQQSSPESSNPGSAAKLTVRAMPDPSVTNSATAAETSFNTDRLECLQSAEHIRLSMHKYLQDKHEHLMRSSQQLVDRRTSGQSSQDTGLQNVQRLIKEKFEQRAEVGEVYLRSRADHTSATPTPSISEKSFVRSLEDLRSISQIERTSITDDSALNGPPSLPVLSSLPLARFLYNSDSNLSGFDENVSWSALPVLEHKDPQQHPLNRWQEKQAGGFSSILRPCDQYPVEPTVRLRPRSQTSNASHRSSMFEFSDYDNISVTDQRHSAASSLNRRKQHQFQQQAFLLEEKAERDADRASICGDAESIVGRRDTTIERTRVRRKSDSESIRDFHTQEDRGKEKDIGRVGGWAADFDKLLRDSAGLQTFAEFLKKEFSHENIYFWCACERYRKLSAGDDRLKLAKEIVSKHLGVAATEPVNVDAVARESTAENLQLANEENPPSADLFSTAQKQIYNLMKFDSFSRFLKSDLYKESLLADMGGTSLPYLGLETLDPELRLDTSLTESLEGEKKKKEEGRRKSILPWGNRNRSKSKDRVEQDRPSLFRGIKLPGQSAGRLSLGTDKSADRSAESRNPLERGTESRNSGSRASLGSNHGDTENSGVTRFILPDKATTVVTPTPGESIRALVSKLLDKRGLKFTSFDAFLHGNEKPLDLSEDCSTLGGAEVRVEPRVLFRLELPSKKSIGVKAKQTKLVEEVLRPILHQYGWNLDQMLVQVERQGVRSGVDYRSGVKSIDNSRLTVSYQNQEMQSKALDEVMRRHSDTESLKTDSRPGSRNSGHHMGFRRQSVSSAESRKQDSSSESRKLDEFGLMPPPAKIPSVRRRPAAQTSPNQVFREQEASLYEGLKRMTQGRLDDQRGLEINGELPDFLRKEENQMMENDEERKQSEDNLLSRLSGPLELGDIHGWDRDHAHRYLEYIDSTFTSDGCIPTSDQADEVFKPVNHEESMH